MAADSITLSTLTGMIQGAMQSAFPDSVWVVAEINELNINRTGHCYMELVEKSVTDDHIVAKSRATIWSSKFRMLRPYFEHTSGTKLQPGIKVLLRAAVSFHQLYGLSLNITDIDPSYTMGEMEMRKREVIARLKAAGIMEMNRELELALVPQRIAVISSETAAGYGDFMGSLVNNSSGFGFSVFLFPAIVQGEAAERSIINALEQVYHTGERFDAVVLIRGGGSRSDLDCFNGYELTMNIAQFPLPVLTGIGHDRDETIADMVAHRSLKTPTAVAEFLIDRVIEFTDYLDRLQERFSQTIQWIIQQQQMTLQQKASDLHHLTQQYIAEEKHALDLLGSEMKRSLEAMLKEANSLLTDFSGKIKYFWRGLYEHRNRDLRNLQEKRQRVIADRLKGGREQLRNIERSLELLRPEKVLARGYSITYSEGKIRKSVKELKKGALLETRMSDGRVHSIVEKTDSSQTIKNK
ncbi:MAG: exodeoxyribonuclease VII large subunit [Bacteroidales bacterium]